MRQAQILVAALLFAGVASNTSAAPIGYGVDGDGTRSEFYRIDFATGTGTLIANIGGNASDFEALSFFGNTLYTINDNNNRLFTIDTATGALTLVGNLGVSVSNPGLAISPSGAAFMGDSSGNDLWTVDLGTGAATLLNGSIGADLQGLTFLGNTLYGVDTGNDSLYTVDTTTGNATLVGAGNTLNGLSSESGLASDGTWLYAADDDGDYFRINPNTGAATVITTNGTDVEGLAIQAVPAPTTLALLGIGLLAFGFNKRKSFN